MTTTVGDERRNEGMEQVLENEGQSEYREAAEHIMRTLIASGEIFSANDFHAQLEDMESHHPNTLGAVFGSASRQGRIKRVGTTTVTKDTGHSRRTSTWIATDAVPRTNEQRYLEALGEIMDLAKSADAEASKPGNRGNPWHGGKLSMVRDINEILHKKRA